MTERGAGARRVIAALVTAALAGCPGGNGANHRTGAGHNSASELMVSGGDVPELPTGFTPAPPLGRPPSGKPTADGHAYLSAIGGPLQDRWSNFLENCRLRLPPSHALNDPSLAVTVSLAVDGSGALIDVAVAAPSGNAEYDSVAMDVVRDSAPFVLPDPKLASDDGLTHVDWLFARDVRQAGVASAVVRRVEWPPDRAIPKLLSGGQFTLAAERLSKASGVAGIDPGGLVVLADQLGTAAIMEALGAGDVATQGVGVRAAESSRLAAAAPLLRQLGVHAVDLDLRRAAVLALGEIGDVEAKPMLVRIASGELGTDPLYISAAARALGQLGAGADAWEAIGAWLTSADAQRRLTALDTLGYIVVSASVVPLVELLADGAVREERVLAAAALGHALGAGEKTAARALIRCLADRNASIRAACADALASAGRAGYTGRPAYWPLVKLIKSDRDERVRAAAVRGAAVIGRGKFSRDIYLLRKEKNSVVLAAAAEGLGWVPGEAAWEFLVKLSLSDDVVVRRGVSLALVRRKEPEARTLLARWASDADPSIRLLGIGALDDLEMLRSLLRDADVSVQAAALKQLGSVSGRGAVVQEVARMLAAASSVSEWATIAQAWFAAR